MAKIPQPISTGAAPGPVSMISATDLTRRPSRLPDYAAENRALVVLAQEMAIAPSDILQKLAETALTLCRAHSAGFSLLEDRDQKKYFRWHAVVGKWAPHAGRGTPRDFGPCGTVLDRNAAMLCSHPERDFPYLGGVSPLLDEGLFHSTSMGKPLARSGSSRTMRVVASTRKTCA